MTDGTPDYQKTATEVLRALASDPQRGLSAGQVSEQRRQHGFNELAVEKPIAAWRKLLAQFRDPLVVLLLAATAISAVLWLVERDARLPYEAIAIFAVVLLNAVIGFAQQASAEKAVAALKQMSAAHAKVIRDGERHSIAARELLPGDIILIEEGDTIPADARLIESVRLQTAEAALTGESLPSAKTVAPLSGESALGDRSNMVFSGTAATYGRGKAVVVATGMKTEMGRIAGMLEDAPAETTPLQKELARVGKLLGVVVMVIAVVMIATILLVEEIHGIAALFDVLILGVALAVAAVPEGLPAVVTAVLALGVQRMARRNAIVRHLAAVETLGSADIIASDKTGTLTRNEMTVRAVVTASGRAEFSGIGYAPTGEARLMAADEQRANLEHEIRLALTIGDRASNAELENVEGKWAIQGDPTEGALIVAARKAGLAGDALAGRFERVGEVPFSSERKLMSTIHEDRERDGELRVFTKGAADVLLERCTHEIVGDARRPLTRERRDAIKAVNAELAGEALRTLAVAVRSVPSGELAPQNADAGVEQDLAFVGLIGMLDPPREEARQAVARARAAGIRAIMITGDHPVTGGVIARELGISEDARALTGAQLERMSDEERAQAVRTVSVYARVNPEHKLRIVQALQRQGNIVAMTGDGVNDAPALKSADIGVAMGITGTDVSKEASDIVLADDNFASIVAAVEEGRAIFANIRKFLRYLLSSNIGEVMTMFFGVLLADWLGLSAAGDGEFVLPLLATQILWVNLVTDGAPALALGIDPAGPDVMQTPPRPRGEGVITRSMWSGIFFVGVIMAVGTLGVLDASLPGGLIEGDGDLHHARTMAFTTLVFFSLFTVFNARSDTRSAFQDMFSNPWLWGAVAFSAALHAAVVYAPFLQNAFSTVALTAGDWALCAAVASSVVWLRELSKLAARVRS